MNITKSRAAKAFSQWETEFREDPKKFMAQKQRKNTKPKTFGELCADTLFRYLKS